MRSALLAFILLIASCAHAQNWGWNRTTVKGDGNVITQERPETGFSKIKACCSLQVELRQGGNFSVEVDAESNLQEFILTEVSGSTLNIGFADNTSVKNKEPIRIRVTLPELTKVDVSSSADVMAKTAFTGDRLRLESSSSGSVTIGFTGREVSADVSSGAKVHVSGQVTSVEAEASSGATLHAEDLEAKQAEADVSSGARIRINVTEELKADASSGGSVRYQGDPPVLKSDSSSGGSVRKG